ncbi:hypothetical protein AB6C57_07000 [Vibrio splendidus]|uniref:hypothetical protein n=1 Tax=Vibrio splendidus TaxID=29497 RepID=UPI00280AC4B3|nr:hypothetical protein [Vibrio splendidus]
MTKSPLAKNSKTNKHVRNSKNVIPLRLTIPYKDSIHRTVTEFDISHLLHLSANSNNDKIESRTPYLRNFCKQAKQYVDNGNSTSSTASIYSNLRSYIVCCDALKISPFSKESYLKYAGNGGELRHRIRMYHPSQKLWERQHDDEIGIKESTAGNSATFLRTALTWCGLPANSWANLHRGFACENTPNDGYSNTEESILVNRLSELFFTLAPQLIAAKKENLPLPDKLHVPINVGGYQETISIETSVKASNLGQSKNGTSVNHSSAFNMTMGAAYHLMCFFTSLNDSDIKSIAHPITIHTGDRDKSLEIVKVSSYKARSNKEVDAILTDEGMRNFDVNKRDGVKFIKLLEKLSEQYDGGSELIFSINNKNERNHTFNLTEINKHLVVKLNLLSPTRTSIIPWFKELFYAYRNQHVIALKTKVNSLARIVVNKVTSPCSKAKATQGATNSAYCILSCYTDLPLKGIMLPLSYSEKGSDGNIRVSFTYRSGSNHCFSIPAADKALVQDIEQFATELADKQHNKNFERLLLKRGHTKKAPEGWEGICPITSSLMRTWSIKPNEYFISLKSSRWREMTSNQVYSDNGTEGVQSTLQNLLETIDKHYANGDPKLNKIIISQAIQVMEQLNVDTSLEQAKVMVVAKLGITMLAHDEWKKNKRKKKPRRIQMAFIATGNKV